MTCLPPLESNSPMSAPPQTPERRRQQHLSALSRLPIQASCPVTMTGMRRFSLCLQPHLPCFLLFPAMFCLIRCARALAAGRVHGGLARHWVTVLGLRVTCDRLRLPSQAPNQSLRACFSGCSQPVPGSAFPHLHKQNGKADSANTGRKTSAMMHSETRIRRQERLATTSSSSRRR